MKYKKYKFDTYNVYTIKTDRFKRCHMEIMFRNNIEKKDITKKVLLNELLMLSSCNYPTKRELNIALEDLYSSYLYTVTSKIGGVITSNFCYDFLSPKYCDKKDVQNIISFPFEIIFNPNIKDNEFDINSFNIVKNLLTADIKSIKDNSKKVAIIEAAKIMDKDNPFSFQATGYLKDLDNITPSNLFSYYNEFIKNEYCDILLIGDMDMDEIVKIINKNFKINSLKNYKMNWFSELKTSKKPKEVIKSEYYAQSELVLGYNIIDVTKREKDVVGIIFNSILGGGTLESKLSKYLRTESALCYNVKSMIQKYNNLLLITAGINKDNFKLATKLVKKSVAEMTSNITEEELNNAKKNIKNTLRTILDSEEGLLSSYYFSEVCDLASLEEKLELVDKVTITDLYKYGKKLKLNTIFLLEGNK